MLAMQPPNSSFRTERVGELRSDWVSGSAIEGWSLRPDDFPSAGSVREQLLFCVRYALLAPSNHNSQPWRYRVSDLAVELRADRARALPVVDPFDRELVISCGAALCNLSMAIARFGRRPDVEILPEPRDPDLLARVALGLPQDPSPLTHLLFDAIVERRTNRQAFEPRTVDPQLVSALRHNAMIEGAWLEEVDGANKETLANLIAEADRTQMRDTHFRRELAAWTLMDGHPRRDGIPDCPMPAEEFDSVPATLLVRTFASDQPGIAARDRALAAGSPLLCVLGTDHEEPQAWIAAGQALQRLWLCATVGGLSLSFLNQPVEVPALRSRLRGVLGRRGFPQLVLRIGYGGAQRPTPRRELAAVLL